jgi:hypothetical protein
LLEVVEVETTMLVEVVPEDYFIPQLMVYLRVLV